MIGSMNGNNSGGMLIENSQMSLWKSSDGPTRCWNRVYPIVENIVLDCIYREIP